MDQGLNTETSLNSSPKNAVIKKHHQVSILSFLGNTHSSSESTFSKGIECAERTFTTSENVHIDDSDKSFNGANPIKGLGCNQPSQESNVTVKELVENVCLRLLEQPNPNDNSLVQSTHNSILYCQTKNISDFSSHITQIQISEEKDDLKKMDCALDHQKKHENIESMDASLSFPHKNQVTVYSVLQCLERAQFLNTNILEQDIHTSSERQLLPTNASSTIDNIPTKTCSTIERMSTNKNDKAQQLATNTCESSDTTKLLSTNVDDTAHLLFSNTGDKSQLLWTVDTVHTIPTNTDGIKMEPTTNPLSYTEQLSATKTTDEPLQMPTSGCHTLDRCKITKYNLRNNAKLSYNIDDDYVTSESDYMDSDVDSSSRFERRRIMTPDISHASHIGVRSSIDQDSCQQKWRTDTDVNTTSQNLKIPSLAYETAHRLAGDPDGYQRKSTMTMETNINVKEENLNQHSFASEKSDGRQRVTVLTSDGGVVDEQHPNIDVMLNEVMKWNVCHVCPVCKQVARNVSEFHEHFRLSIRCQNTYRDGTGEGFTCQLCNFQSKKCFGLVRHLRTQSHNENETVNFPAQALNDFAKGKKTKNRFASGYCCQICDSVVNRHDNAVRHLETHLKTKAASCPVCEKTFSNDLSLYNHMKLHKKKSNSDISEVKPPLSSFGSDQLESRFDGKDTLPQSRDVCTEQVRDKYSDQMANGNDNRANTNAAVDVLYELSSSTETVHSPNECSTDTIKLIQDKLDENLHNGEKETLTSDIDFIEQTRMPDIVDKIISNARPAGDPGGIKKKSTMKTNINVEEENLNQHSFAGEKSDGRQRVTMLTSNGGVVDEQHPNIDVMLNEVMKWNVCHVCPVCKHIARNVSEFFEHFLVSYKCQNTYRDCTGKGFKCRVCNFKSEDRYGLVRHLVTQRHDENEAINFLVNSLSTKSAHAPDDFAKGGKTKKRLSAGYCCQICDSVVNRRNNAVRHLKTHLKTKAASCCECKETFSNDWLLYNHMKLHKKKSNSDVCEVKSPLSSFGSDQLESRFDGKDTLPQSRDVCTEQVRDKYSDQMANGNDNRANTNAAVDVLYELSSSTETVHSPNECSTYTIKLIQDKFDENLHNGEKETLTSDVDFIEQTPDIVDKTISNARPAGDPGGIKKKSTMKTNINVEEENLNQHSFAGEKSDGRQRVTMLTSNGGVVDEQHPNINVMLNEVMKWNVCHVCPVCKHVARNVSELYEHFLVSYKCQNTYRDCTGKGFECRLCNFKSEDRYGLVRHLVTQRHNENETINFPENSSSTKPAHAPCDFAKSGKTKKRLSDGYRCQICDSVANRRNNAVRHLKTHLKTKAASCCECKETFSNDWSLYNHMKLHKKKSNSDLSEVESPLSSFGSDQLESRFDGKDTLPQSRDVCTELVRAKGIDNRADTNAAVDELHDVSSSTETEHTRRQCTIDVTKDTNYKLCSQKNNEIEQMDITETTQDFDDKSGSQVRSVNPPNGHQTATKTNNTTENQVKLCFAFQTSKMTKKEIFEQTTKSHRFLEIHQLLKWNASHECPVCKVVSKSQIEFFAHFVKSKKCRLYFLVSKLPRAKYSCKPCSYLNKTFRPFLGHLMRNRKHGDLTCETFPAHNIKSFADEEYRGEENSIDKDNITGNSEEEHGDGELANQRQIDKAGTNTGMHQSEKFTVGYSCQICGAVIFNVIFAHKHIYRHTNNTLYECQTCNDQHILKGKLDSEHCCRNCGSKGFLLRNISSGKPVSRSLQKAYQCLVCKEHFFESQDLNDHMNNHVAMDCTCGQCLERSLKYADKRSFICKFCGSGFKMISHLQCHVLNRHKDGKTVPVQEIKEAASLQHVETKKKRNVSTRGNKIVNKHKKVALAKDTRKRTLSAVGTSPCNEMPKKRLKRNVTKIND